MFNRISFIPRSWWRCLLYKDRANYGGIRLQVDADNAADSIAEKHADVDAMEADDDVSVPMDEEDVHATLTGGSSPQHSCDARAAQDVEQDRVEINFNVAKYLPSEMQIFFHRVVAEFIQVPVQTARALEAARIYSQEPANASSQADAVAEALGMAVKTSLTRRLCLMVDHIERKYDGAAGAELAQAEAQEDEASGKQRRPPGLGDAPGYGRVALDFVKTVSHVFGLDQDAQKEVTNEPDRSLTACCVHSLSAWYTVHIVIVISGECACS